MNTLRSLRLPLILSIVSAIGIVGMLLYEGGADVLCFALAAAPLAIGTWAWWRWTATARRDQAGT